LVTAIWAGLSALCLSRCPPPASWSCCGRGSLPPRLARRSGPSRTASLPQRGL